MKTSWISRKILLNLLFIVSVVIAGCERVPPHVSIENAKAELSPAIVGEAMVTMSIRNQGGSDTLTGVKTDIPGAKVSFHVMKRERMILAASVKIPSQGNIEFKMGGSHIMIEEMPTSMKEGSKFNLTLIFRQSGERQVPLVLQPAMAMPMEHDHQM